MYRIPKLIVSFYYRYNLHHVDGVCVWDKAWLRTPPWVEPGRSRWVYQWACLETMTISPEGGVGYDVNIPKYTEWNSINNHSMFITEVHCTQWTDWLMEQRQYAPFARVPKLSQPYRILNGAQTFPQENTTFNAHNKHKHSIIIIQSYKKSCQWKPMVDKTRLWSTQWWGWHIDSTIHVGYWTQLYSGNTLKANLCTCIAHVLHMYCMGWQMGLDNTDRDNQYNSRRSWVVVTVQLYPPSVSWRELHSDQGEGMLGGGENIVFSHVVWKRTYTL